MLYLLFIVLAIAAYSFYFLSKPVFGNMPEGKRYERIKQSKQFKEGSFFNLEPTPNFAPGVNTWDAAKSFLSKPLNTEPASPLPFVHTDLKQLNPNVPTLIWFGHSSYFMQVEGVKLLVDPVFSGNASPIKLFAKSFIGTDNIHVEDIPEFDILLLTHDHYDHLDYETILKLKGKFKKVITSLGVGAHLNLWGIPNEQITELDWWEEAILRKGFTIKATPARHFSGRKFKRNQSLWSSFVFTTPNFKIFLGGDSGYGKHFREIGEKEGPFDLALLECGQYNKMWPYIHMQPEEVVIAAKDLNTKVLMPVHWGKFALAMHAWNEPIKLLYKEAFNQKQKITTPKIGEAVFINQHYPDNVWWEV